MPHFQFLKVSKAKTSLNKKTNLLLIFESILRMNHVKNCPLGIQLNHWLREVISEYSFYSTDFSWIT